MANIAAILIMMVLIPAGTTSRAATEEAPAPAQLTLVDATAEQGDMVDEAIAQFHDAGLELPPLQIEFYDDNEGCRGHAGLFVGQSRDPEANVDRISICNRAKVILLHELAHAWMHHSVDDDTQAAFTEHWSLDHWNHADVAWEDRSVERAANTIAFTLHQADATDSESVLRYICGYELLTGSTLDIHTKVQC